MNKMPRKKTDRKIMADHAVLLTGHVESHNLHLPKLGSIREIQHRAETVTPILKEILDFRPLPHW